MSEKIYRVEHRVTKDALGVASWRPGWEWIVTGYEDGQLVLQTGHKTQSSMEMECKAWESRGFRQEVTGVAK